MIFLDFARQVLDPLEANLLYDSFGYSTELTIMNAYDAVQMIENHLAKRSFYVLGGGGLSQIINKLTEILEKSDYVTIRRGCHIDDISSLPTGGYRLLSGSRNSPLCRIYSVLEGSGEYLPHRFTTNTDIRYYIPIRGDVAMVSYTDNDYARKWNRIYEENGVNVLNRELKKELERTTGHIDSIPKHTKIFYWNCGVGYWGVGADSENFDYEPRKGLFICGENVSAKNQQWIEGALDTARWVLERVI